MGRCPGGGPKQPKSPGNNTPQRLTPGGPQQKAGAPKAPAFLVGCSGGARRPYSRLTKQAKRRWAPAWPRPSGLAGRCCAAAAGAAHGLPLWPFRLRNGQPGRARKPRRPPGAFLSRPGTPCGSPRWRPALRRCPSSPHGRTPAHRPGRLSAGPSQRSALPAG